MAKKKTTRNKTAAKKTVAKKVKKKTASRTLKKKVASRSRSAVKPAAGKKVSKKPLVVAGRKKPKRVSRPVAVIQAVDEPTEALTVAQLRKVKTGLSKRDLSEFRKLLLQKRMEIFGDVESMKTDARMKNAGGNLSNMPVHMADVGSDNYEQEFTLGLVESERRLLMEIDQALYRMEEGVYGVCLERGVPIGRARLEAKPWAAYCIEVARERDRRNRV